MLVLDKIFFSSHDYISGLQSFCNIFESNCFDTNPRQSSRLNHKAVAWWNSKVWVKLFQCLIKFMEIIFLAFPSAEYSYEDGKMIFQSSNLSHSWEDHHVTICVPMVPYPVILHIPNIPFWKYCMFIEIPMIIKTTTRVFHYQVTACNNCFGEQCSIIKRSLSPKLHCIKRCFSMKKELSTAWWLQGHKIPPLKLHNVDAQYFVQSLTWALMDIKSSISRNHKVMHQAVWQNGSYPKPFRH